MNESSARGIEYGGKLVELELLVDEWARRIVEVSREARLTDSPNDARTIHDLIGAYYLRDAIARGLSRQARPRDIPSLEAVDELLQITTAIDTDGVLERIESGEPHPGWWWRRVPTAGPIAAEVKEISERLSAS